MKNSLTKPKAIVFDWDNTLIKTWPKIHFAINATLKHFKMSEWDLETVMARMHKSTKESFPEFFGEDKFEEAIEVYYKAFDLYSEDVNLFDGAQETLKLISNMGIYLAIVSNKRGAALRNEVREKDVDEYFSNVVGSGDCKEDKPSVLPLLATLRGNEFKPQDIWFVGDTEIDMKMARKFGCAAIAYGANDRMDCDLHFKNHTVLQVFLKNNLTERSI